MRQFITHSMLRVNEIKKIFSFNNSSLKKIKEASQKEIIAQLIKVPNHASTCFSKMNDRRDITVYFSTTFGNRP